MKLVEVTVVRIYCMEAEHKLDRLLKLLHDQEQVAGVTAFRGIAGFGRSGKMHEAALLDMSLDLPLLIEFFDRPEKNSPHPGSSGILYRSRTPGELVR